MLASPTPAATRRRTPREKRTLIAGALAAAFTLLLIEAAHLSLGLSLAAFGAVAVVTLPLVAAAVAQHRAAALDRQIARLRAQQEEARRDAASLAHDVRSPLNTVTSYLDLLAEGAFGPISGDARTAIERAVRASSRLRDLVDGLLLEAQAAAAAPIATGRVDLNAVVDDVIEVLSTEVSATGGEVRVAPLPPVHGDEAMLFRVFANLVQNSLKYAAPGQPPRVQVTGRRAGAYVEVDVRDWGIGIPFADRERVFAREARAANGAEQADGLGLGLATVRRLARDLDGDAWVAPDVTPGTSIRVALRSAGR
ncbi:MAG: ATP-binding protein [Dehalococcoidia bacterium]